MKQVGYRPVFPVTGEPWAESPVSLPAQPDGAASVYRPGGRLGMRVLFTTRPEYGHFHPLVPLARALAQAEHEVAFACPASFIPVVAASGFDAFPAGFDQRD